MIEACHWCFGTAALHWILWSSCNEDWHVSTVHLVHHMSILQITFVSLNNLQARETSFILPISIRARHADTSPTCQATVIWGMHMHHSIEPWSQVKSIAGRSWQGSWTTFRQGAPPEIFIALQEILHCAKQLQLYLPEWFMTVTAVSKWQHCRAMHRRDGVCQCLSKLNSD